jgi:hypothetical protein
MPTPDNGSSARRRTPSASPAERGAQFAAHQQRLKQEAAERRERAAAAPPRIAQPRRKVSRG